MEIDLPTIMGTKVSKLTDYPPRIVIKLTPNQRAVKASILSVAGLKFKCQFAIPVNISALGKNA